MLFWHGTTALVSSTPANFSRFRVLPSYCSDVAHRRPTKLCTMFDRLLAITLCIHFRGLMPPERILPGAKFTYVQILRSPIFAALLHGTPAAGVSQTLRRGTRMWFRNFRRGRHLYLAGRPSRWATAHILVMAALCNRGPLYFCPVVSSIFFPFFPRLISAVADWMSTIPRHMAWP